MQHEVMLIKSEAIDLQLLRRSTLIHHRERSSGDDGDVRRRGHDRVIHHRRDAHSIARKCHPAITLLERVDAHDVKWAALRSPCTIIGQSQYDLTNADDSELIVNAFADI